MLLGEEPLKTTTQSSITVIDSTDTPLFFVLDLSAATAQDLIEQILSSGGECDGHPVLNGTNLDATQSLSDAALMSVKLSSGAVDLVGVCRLYKITIDPLTCSGVSEGDTLHVRPHSAYDKSSCIARVAFWWASPLITLGAKRPLIESDVWETAAVDRVHLQVSQLEHAWQQEIHSASTRNPEWKQQLRAWHAERAAREEESNKENLSAERPRPEGPSITSALLRVFRTPLIVWGLVKLINDLIQYAPPLIIAAIVSWAAEDDPDPSTGYILAALYSASIFSKSILENQYFFNMTRVGINARAALMTMMYKKALRINLACGSDFGLDSGQIIQLMNTDTEFLLAFTPQLHQLWSCLLQVVGTVALLIVFLGPSALAGVFVLVCLIPITGTVQRKLMMAQRSGVVHADARVSLIRDILQGCRIIKFYSWEQSMATRVGDVRAKELTHIEGVAKLSAISSVFMFSAPHFVAISAFLVYVGLAGEELTPSKVFAALALFDKLRFPLIMLPMVLAQVATYLVSASRFSDFLGMDELQSRLELGEVTQNTLNPLPVGVASSSVGLPPTQVSSPVAQEMAIQIITDAKADCGTKSSRPADRPVLHMKKAVFLLDNSNEVPVTLKVDDLSAHAGELVGVVGPVGSGKSSLLSAMLKEVQLVSGEMELHGSVAFVPQTAWICNDTIMNNILFGLAFDEARYRQALHVSCLGPDLENLQLGDQTMIGERGINLSGGQKQRVSIARAFYVDAEVYIFDDPLSALDADVANKIWNRLNSSLSHTTRICALNQPALLAIADSVVVLADLGVSSVGKYEDLTSQLAALAEKPKDETDSVAPDADKAAAVDTNTVVDTKDKEIQRQGSIEWKHYVAYFKAFDSPLLFVFNMFMQVLLQVCNVGVVVWLAWWSEDKWNESTRTYMLVYVSLGLASSIFMYCKGITWAVLCVRASSTLHRQLFKSVISSNMGWFDRTPVGRILNRFSNDMNTVDRLLPMNMNSCFQLIGMNISVVVLLAIIVPWYLVCMPVLMFMFYNAQTRYLASSRELKRIDSTSRSPIYASFSETLNGLATIRSFGFESHFTGMHEAKVEISTRAIFAAKTLERWLAIRLEMIGNVLVMAVCIACVNMQSDISAAMIGLSLVYANMVTFTLSFAVRICAECENQMSSVERVRDYVENLPLEFTSDPQLPSEAWPAEGTIRFNELTVKYRDDLEPALTKVSATIAHGQKIGVIGRTGSGKSTLALALFRLINVAPNSIFIDQQDIATLPLDILRKSISIIPQDPVIFAGSVAFNLDPFGEHCEERLFDVLDQVQLGARVRSGGGLLQSVTESGANFSLGEIQLLCIARALLRDSRILVLDEATASVDDKTDNLIQTTIRTAFAKCTVLTIAHRIWTIIDSDQIIVLEKGELIDMAPPLELYHKGGKFAELVAATGNQTQLLAAMEGGNGNNAIGAH